MRTEEEIREKIAVIDADKRLKGKLALVQINAPLALIQCSLATQRDILEWVLNEED